MTAVANDSCLKPRTAPHGRCLLVSCQIQRNENGIKPFDKWQTRFSLCATLLTTSFVMLGAASYLTVFIRVIVSSGFA